MPVSPRKFLWSSAGLILALPLGVWLLEFSQTLHAVTELMVAHLP
jgi:hypothetical protein